MQQLLTKYSLSDLIIIVFLILLAIKEAYTIIEWCITKLRGAFGKQTDREKQKEDILGKINANKSEIDGLKDQEKEILKAVNKMTDSIQLLMESDKDDIKAWITEKHHYFCYEKHYIDDYSLDCIEKRYSHYVAEKGNSFVSDLMEDLRKLPKVSAIK